MQLIQQLINGLMLGGILAFVAVAFTLTIGMLNFLNFTIPALFMVALGRGVKEAQLKSGIERLVDLSGGRALFVERSEQLDQPFAEILEELSNQYILGYESSNTARNGAWREVKLEVPGTSYSVRARQGYRAPGS